MSKQSGWRMRCAGTPVPYEQAVREEDAASVCGYTGTLAEHGVPVQLNVRIFAT